ncbi:VOC family protein [Mycobacterium sp. CVI_P3]|uniref:VOC family protein n=1 Tax=Mycobacterium pinniadriaticum TaxID=2994102 RepID=A0ABT3S7T5_9MYCO|nr:VOC family protein [Mycobacterium pinniadriaticum]MCX2929141.1 VOC family protein [Mycobacterium pinniadriaticum]MCX2935566.1 VOC family protein [Mycobacterium pinniadriaticum]
MATTEPVPASSSSGTAKRLSHVALQTGQLPVLRDWYLTVLDAHVVFENEVLCLMTFDEEHHRIAMRQLPRPDERTSRTVGLGHSSYTFATLSSLLSKYESLKDAGIRPYLPVQHGITTSLYYRDPDGNLAELQIQNMPAEEATQYLYGEECRLDPVGPSFDPDLMLAALRSGTSESELITRSWALSCPQLNVTELLMS